MRNRRCFSFSFFLFFLKFFPQPVILGVSRREGTNPASVAFPPAFITIPGSWSWDVAQDMSLFLPQAVWAARCRNCALIPADLRGKEPFCAFLSYSQAQPFSPTAVGVIQALPGSGPAVCCSIRS